MSSCSAQIKSTVKRKLYEDSRVPIAADASKKTAKKPAGTTGPGAAPAMIAVSTPQVVVATGMQGGPSLAPPLKKQKTAGEKRQAVTSGSGVRCEFGRSVAPDGPAFRAVLVGALLDDSR